MVNAYRVSEKPASWLSLSFSRVLSNCCVRHFFAELPDTRAHAHAHATAAPRAARPSRGAPAAAARRYLSMPLVEGTPEPASMLTAWRSATPSACMRLVRGEGRGVSD